MPRSGSGVYTQPFPDVVEDTTIESLVYNGFTRDVEVDLNAPRPIVAGGTGANNATEALENLHGVDARGDTMTGSLIINPGNLTLTNTNPNLILNKKLSGETASITGQLVAKNRWKIILGDSIAETAEDGVGSNFSISRYDNAGALVEVPFAINRSTGMVAITSSVTPPPPGDPAGDIGQLAINKPVATQSAAILGQSLGVTRWRLNLGDVATESGTQKGSNFRLERYTNDGTFIDFPVYIERETGQITLSGTHAASTTQPPAILTLNATTGTAAAIQGRKNGAVRWHMSLGDGTGETGFNQGSDFRLQRYDDTGNLIDVPIWIDRTTGVVTFTGSPPDQKPIITINKTSGAGGQSSSIQGQTLTSTRWHLSLGDGQPETGGNQGSHFRIHRHDDSGNYITAAVLLGRHDGQFTVNGVAAKPGGGVCGVSSDARIKTVTGEYTQGLAAVLQLRPVTFRFNGTDVTYPQVGVEVKRPPKGQPDPESPHYTVAMSGKEFVGLVAQEAEVPMPEMVTQIAAELDGAPVSDLRVLDATALLYALVNSVKELAARVEALEAVKR